MLVYLNGRPALYGADDGENTDGQTTAHGDEDGEVDAVGRWILKPPLLNYDHLWLHCNDAYNKAASITLV